MPLFPLPRPARALLLAVTAGACVTSLAFGSENAAGMAPSARSGAETGRVVESAPTTFKRSPGVGFGRYDELEEFWYIHTEFGFIRDPEEEERVLLIAKDDAIAARVIGELSAFTKKDPSGAEKVPESPVEESVAFDVSTLLDRTMKERHWTRTIGSGSNCWNFALWLHGILPGLYSVDAEEFTDWADDASMFTRVREQSEVRPGDIATYRTKAPGELTLGLVEIHAAYVVSPGIVFSKNGSSESAAFRLQEFDEVNRVYLTGEKVECALADSFENPDCVGYVVYLRPTSEAKAFFRTTDLSPESEPLRKDVLAFHASGDRVHAPLETDEDSPADRGDYLRSARPLFDRLKQREAGAAAAGSGASADELTLLRRMRLSILSAAGSVLGD